MHPTGNNIHESFIPLGSVQSGNEVDLHLCKVRKTARIRISSLCSLVCEDAESSEFMLS